LFSFGEKTKGLHVLEKKGCFYGRLRVDALKTPAALSGLGNFVDGCPRASLADSLPWAIIFRAFSPSTSAARNAVAAHPFPSAHDELLLHMQQSFAQGYSGLNVRSCRLASRSTSTRRRHACCGGL